MEQSQTLSPTRHPRQFRTADGQLVSPPDGWECLPPGDAGLTRRVKALGPTWTVIEQKGRKKFSHGVWAPAENIVAARQHLAGQRADPAYQRRRAQSAQRRQATQTDYVATFRAEVLAFLSFAPCHAILANRLADAVTAQATPVGSGTVARTQRLSVDRRAEAAVIAWLRHQTTAYDSMKIARKRGERRRVRQQLAGLSRALLNAHRRDAAHDAPGCPLCRTLLAGGTPGDEGATAGQQGIEGDQSQG